ncbi:hypothetical protein COL154_000082 [Colletotrichum chrysophilum]|uniref:uncharacterized protein n=1 Tax=Colletotrichum chrysophilum TaxID=1836956 RepID=UPI0023012A73|nr:uncharacterized protein COL26b_002262 [Colletotrichum chrysophilum]KAJ0354076.1 hypothetical protein KNSL1_001650 [Colletotrichum chrysophilum]KAJ0372359.1 hypothetical protein COL154_000082 [Colletotrichum chrysophilum]KAJ0379419.1 hypothetical protein COL26b_002262 [Colletotrichum chrysophilum]
MEDFSDNAASLGMGPGSLPKAELIKPAEVRALAAPMAEEVLQQWDLLRKIVERHEATIQNRWIKKSKSKRRGVLLAAWPDMSEYHRPDFAAFRKKRSGEQAREGCLWPHINLEDLSKTEPLLLMINSRGRNTPDVFAMNDVEESRFGQVSRTMDMPRFLNLYSMMFLGRCTPQTYGTLVSWDDEPDASTWNFRRTAFHPGEGLWILEFQSRLYRFLVDVCKSILHDISPEELTDLEMDIPPEPPLVTGNSNDSIAASLAVTRLEGPYRVPARLDIAGLQSIIKSKLAEAEDHIWALREDPDYFSVTVRDWKEHRQEMMLDTNGKPHPIHAHAPDVFWQRLIGNMISSAMFPVEVYRSLAEKIDHLIDLKDRKYRNRNFKPDENPTTTIIQVTSVGDRSKDATVAELFWIIDTLFDEKQLFLTGLPTLLDELERVTRKDRAASQMISGWVAAQIADLSVLSECERQLDLFQPWAASFESDIAENQTEIDRDFHELVRRLVPINDLKIGLATARMGIPDGDKFKYLVERKRNKQNINQMRAAERALDSFWADIQQSLCGRDGISSRLRNILQRSVQRTPEWVETAKAKAPAAEGQDPSLAAPFGGLSMQDTPKEKPSPRPKTKLKTKGAVPVAATTPVQDQEQPQAAKRPLFKVDKRALKVFNTLFFNPLTSSSPVEIPWTEFLHAMQSVGFHMEKLYGSAWKFTPTKLDVETSIQFHEPHPSSKLPFVFARRIGRRLNREYGLEGDMFVSL